MSTAAEKPAGGEPAPRIRDQPLREEVVSYRTTPDAKAFLQQWAAEEDGGELSALCRRMAAYCSTFMRRDWRPGQPR